MERISMKFDLQFKSFHQENAFANIVYEMATILSRLQCVKGKNYTDETWFTLDDIHQELNKYKTDELMGYKSYITGFKWISLEKHGT